MQLASRQRDHLDVDGCEMQLASRPRDDLDPAECPRPGRSTTYHRRLGGFLAPRGSICGSPFS
jgi:hypothetical protein